MNSPKNRLFLLTALLTSLLIAVCLSPFASRDPDGLDRVARDLNFNAKEVPATQRPFAKVVEGYRIKGVPETLATPLAGLLGTLATFGIAWGIGKLAIPKADSSPDSLENTGND